jgi:hypothetical protein
MIFAGQYSPSVAYLVTDVVTWNGSTYIAIAASTNKQPDTNPNTWAVLALAGAAGPAGPTGPEGPQGAPGGGSSIAVPVVVSQGGTGSTTPAGALANLGAAASGANSDITSLSGIVVGANAVSIQPNQISITNGAVSTNITPGGIATGAITAGAGLISGVLDVGAITCAVPNSTLTLGSWGGSTCVVVINNGLIIEGSIPACGAGQIGFGALVSASASAGGGASLPSTVAGFIEVSIQGTTGKIPFYSS